MFLLGFQTSTYNSKVASHPHHPSEDWPTHKNTLTILTLHGCGDQLQALHYILCNIESIVVVQEWLLYFVSFPTSDEPSPHPPGSTMCGRGG